MAKISFDEFYARRADYFGKEPSESLEFFISMYNVAPCSALDIGAGEGRNTFFLAKQGFDVTAIEPSPVGATYIRTGARSLGGAGHISVINETYLDAMLGGEKYDLIFAVTALDHMTLDDVKKSVKDIKSRLSSRGYVFFVVFTELDPGNTESKKNASDCAGQIKHYFRQNELKELFSDFEILEYVEFFKHDASHGKPHDHHKAKLIARKK